MKKWIGLFIIATTIVVAWGGYDTITSKQEHNTINELKRLLKDTYIVDLQYPYTEGKKDAVVVYTTTGMPKTDDFYVTSNVVYYERVGGKWEIRSGAHFTNEELGQLDYWSMSQTTPRLYHGVFNFDDYDGTQTMWVDGQHATQIHHKDSNKVFWYAFADDYAQVVREDKSGNFKRLKEFYDNTDGPWVWMTPLERYNKTIGKEYVYEYSGDAMRYERNEDNDLPLIIIPIRNVTGFEAGEVLLVEKENGEVDVARIIVSEGTVEVQNGKIICSTCYWQQDLITYAKVDGYHSKIEYEKKEDKEAPEVFNLTMPAVTLGEDEYFVAPDNWGSESVLGVIKKAQIIGKVKGYYDPLALYPLSNG